MDKRKGLALAFSLSLLLTGGSAFLTNIEFSDPLETVGDVGCNVMLSWMSPSFCGFNAEDIEVNDDNTVSLENSIYGNGLTTADEREQTAQNLKANVNQSYGIGSARAKALAFEGLNNGSTKSEIQNKGISTINDFYSTVQDQIVTYRNREIIGLNASITRASEDSQINVWHREETCGDYISDNDRISTEQGLFDYSNAGGPNKEILEVKDYRVISQNLTLYNGTEVKSYGIEADAEIRGENGCEFDQFGNVQNVTLYSPQFNGETYQNGGTIRVFNSDGSNVTDYVRQSEWDSVNDRVNSNYERSVENVNPLISNIFEKYSAGEINMSDLELGPLETLKTASTNYESTGFYDYRALSLQQMGYASNESYAFNVSWDGEKTSLGQLFVPESFTPTTLEVGETYQTDGSRVEILYDDGSEKAVRETIDSNFTINKMTDKESGETVNQTSVQPVNWYSGNVTDIRKQFDRLNEIQDRQLDIDIGFGGWGGFGDGSGILGIGRKNLLILALIIGFVLYVA